MVDVRRLSRLEDLLATLLGDYDFQIVPGDKSPGIKIVRYPSLVFDAEGLGPTRLEINVTSLAKAILDHEAAA